VDVELKDWAAKGSFFIQLRGDIGIKRKVPMWGVAEKKMAEVQNWVP